MQDEYGGERRAAWRCSSCRTITHSTAPPDACAWCLKRANDSCGERKTNPLRFMIHAQGRLTTLQLDQWPDGEIFAINGHVLEDARAVQIEKVGDRIRVSFMLETGKA